MQVVPLVQSASVEHWASPTGEKQDEATSANAATRRADFMENLEGAGSAKARAAQNAHHPSKQQGQTRAAFTFLHPPSSAMVFIDSQASPALKGRVTTHATRMLVATPHRTADSRFDAPTPMMQALMT